MGLTMEEQETVITFDRSSNVMNIYTADRFLMERLDKLPSIYRKWREQKKEGVVVSADYKAEKRFLTLRKKDRLLLN